MNNEKKLEELFDKATAEAEDLLQDEDKMERFLQKLEMKLKTVPMVGNSLRYVPMMISMVRMYMKKEYTVSDFCDCKSTVFMLRGDPERNLYHAIAEIFG